MAINNLSLLLKAGIFKTKTTVYGLSVCIKLLENVYFIRVKVVQFAQFQLNANTNGTSLILAIILA